MQSFYCLLSLIVCLGLTAASDVLDFTDKNFDDKAKEHEIILIEFFAPWCGHCKKLAPEYEKAATKLKSNDPPVSLAKVDCTAEKATCDRFGVSGFPTLKIFRNGEFSAEYEGPREAEGIVKYMRGQAGPSSKELETIKDIEKFTDNDEASVIGFFEKDSRLKDSFQKVADTERDRYRFAHTSSKEILAKYKATDDIIVFQPKRLHTKFEEPQLKYSGNYDTDKIKKFLQTEMQGICGLRTAETAASFEKPLVVVYYTIDFTKDPKGFAYWRNRICKIASELKGKKIHFAVSNKDDFSHELDEYGLADKKDSKNPIVAGHGAKGEKFPMTAEWSLDALKKFADDLLAGKLESFLKSEPIPESNDGPVAVVVAKNFDDIVNQDKDVLIEFYAPWCGHCKKLAPVFDELGEKLKKESVVIAKMDATANDVPQPFTVHGFPTLYWVPKGKKSNPVQYNGGRDLKDFIEYIARESTDGLKGYDRKGKKKEEL